MHTYFYFIFRLLSHKNGYCLFWIWHLFVGTLLFFSSNYITSLTPALFQCKRNFAWFAGLDRDIIIQLPDFVFKIWLFIFVTPCTSRALGIPGSSLIVAAMWYLLGAIEMLTLSRHKTKGMAWFIYFSWDMLILWYKYISHLFTITTFSSIKGHNYKLFKLQSSCLSHSRFFALQSIAI